jgi:hypothetical protein
MSGRIKEENEGRYRYHKVYKLLSSLFQVMAYLIIYFLFIRETKEMRAARQYCHFVDDWKSVWYLEIIGSNTMLNVCNKVIFSYLLNLNPSTPHLGVNEISQIPPPRTKVLDTAPPPRTKVLGTASPGPKC